MIEQFNIIVFEKQSRPRLAPAVHSAQQHPGIKLVCATGARDYNFIGQAILPCLSNRAAEAIFPTFCPLLQCIIRHIRFTIPCAVVELHPSSPTRFLCQGSSDLVIERCNEATKKNHLLVRHELYFIRRAVTKIESRK